MMSRRLKLLAMVALCAFAHAAVTIACIVYAGTSTFAHFDNPDVPALFAANAADRAAKMLVMPGDLIYSGPWGVRNVPASVQNLVFAGNSILWGFAGVVAITVWRRSRFNPRQNKPKTTCE